MTPEQEASERADRSYESQMIRNHAFRMAVIMWAGITAGLMILTAGICFSVGVGQTKDLKVEELRSETELKKTKMEIVGRCTK